jgi:hypothetical protein
MKSNPKVTDGPAGAGPRVAEVICPRPGSTFRTGISGTWSAKASDKRGLIVLGVLKVVQGGVGILNPGLRPVFAVPVPVVAGPGLGGGVTNTPDTVLSTSSAIGLDGGVWYMTQHFGQDLNHPKHCLYFP